jgi:dye decolorizing peroxidase
MVVDDQGLLFICFQRDLQDFVRTQRRLDEVDDLMQYVTPVSTGAFLILPGFDAARPLGHGLLA